MTVKSYQVSIDWTTYFKNWKSIEDVKKSIKEEYWNGVVIQILSIHEPKSLK